MSAGVDFEARLADHHCLLVLVQPLVPAAGSLWERALGHIRRVRWTRLSDQQQPDGSRCVWLRYATSYPADGSLWGDFQAHRRVLGVLTVGECSESHSVEALCGLHEQLLHQHPTAIDSRCFLFGSRPTPPGGDGEEDGATKGQEGGEEARMAAPSMGKLRSTQCLLYPSLDGEQVERDVAEFAASLAWVLESRRLERSFDRPSSSSALPLLKAPFEDFVGLDTDSRQFRRRCQGRQRKQLGDLSLQLGLGREAQALYAEAQELLRGVPDWLWLAATLEGAVAATCPPSHPPSSSSSSGPGATPPPAEANKTGGDGEAPPPSQQQPKPPAPPPSTTTPWLVPVEEGWEELRESCLHYAKYSPVAPIQAECAVKAARWLAAHARPLGAAEFVQSVVSMNLAQSDPEKVTWYGSLARLYAELGLGRKAAFYMRVAALKCMVGKPNPTQCYQLLLKSLPGYRISMDPGKPAKAGPTDGWPRLQIQLLQDLLVTAKKMDNLGLAVSHLCQLLESLLDWLSPSERTEACQQLQTLASRLQGPASAQPPLLHLPLVRRFQPQAPAPHLRPLRLGSHGGGGPGGGGQGGGGTQSSSPFIFSPLQPHRRPGRPPMLWVQGEVAAVALQLGNPLPSELAVQHMSLLAEGVPLESFPASLELPPESSPYPVKLLGTPRATGELRLLGYSTCVLGVHSRCVLSHPPPAVTVVAPLPLLEVTADLPQAAHFATVGDAAHVVNNYSLVLYAGERRECELTLTNMGSEPIEMLELNLQTKLDKGSQRSLIRWDAESLQAQLPLLPEAVATLNLEVHGQAPFLLPGGSADSSDSAAAPSTRVVETVLQLRYSGGPGLVARYCRQLGLALTLEVQPSLLVSRWDVLPAQDPTECHLVLDLRNETEHELELRAGDERQPMLMEAKDFCRIPVTVRRCAAKGSSGGEGEGEAEEDGSARLSRLEAACRQHLREAVTLRWCLPSLERGGEANLDEVPWTPHMLDTIVQSPLQWEVQVDGRVHSPEQEYVFPVGEPLRLSVLLRNVSPGSLQRLWLSAVGYQDRQNGTLSYRLDSKLVFVGSDKLFIEQVEPGESQAHEFTLVFLLTGVYKLELSCRAQPQPKPQPKQPLRDEEERMWKCCPPIEVTVAADGPPLP